MEKFIIANHTALRIDDTLKGDTCVVLLHGYLESLEIWDDLAKLLAQQYRVLRIDIPGLGISQVNGAIHTMEFLADVLHDVLEKQGVKRCFVVGHSMGGYVAEAFAAQYPEQLEGIVLFHSTPNADSDEKKANRLREIELVQADKKELIAELFAPKGFAEANRRRLHEKIEQLAGQIIMSDDEGIIALLRGMMERKDQNEMMRALKVPQLFIFGRGGDEFIPVAVAEQLATEHPQAEIGWLEHSGHMGFIEESEQSAAILSDFIEHHKDAASSEASVSAH